MADDFFDRFPGSDCDAVFSADVIGRAVVACVESVDKTGLTTSLVS